MVRLSFLWQLTALVAATTATPAGADEHRPNILFAIADDWGWPHAGAYGDPVVKTPNFDRLAREGVLLEHAYVSSPSCTPSRGAILTGQFHWRLGGAGNLHSVFPDRLKTYPEILREAGYQLGVRGKAWGPGKTETPEREPAGQRFESFEQFLSLRDKSKPFCFWLGSGDPHRPYELGSGQASGMDLGRIQLPACFPDSLEVRGDVADYYFEVQRFDTLVGTALAALEAIGELDNTLVMMTGDHGMPFPRAKANLYDTGTRVPFAVRWPRGGIVAGGSRDEMVSLCDVAPTVLAATGIAPPADMTGRSFLTLAQSPDADIDPARGYVLFGKERHVPGQEAPDLGGYPCRGIRTHDYLYIKNFTPDRWPAGTPHYRRAAIPGNWYADVDNGPTKTYMIENRDQDETHRRLYRLAFDKRPAEELYDLSRDPDQLENVAGIADYAQIKRQLADQLTDELRRTRDPRVVGGVDFDAFPYLGGGPKHPDWSPPN